MQEDKEERPDEGFPLVAAASSSDAGAELKYDRDVGEPDRRSASMLSILRRLRKYDRNCPSRASSSSSLETDGALETTSSFVRRTGVGLPLPAAGLPPIAGDDAGLPPGSFSLTRLGSVIQQLRQVSAIADEAARVVDPGFAGPPRYPGPIPIPAAAAGSGGLVITGLLGDGGGVSIGEERLDEEAEDELALIPWCDVFGRSPPL